jgi:hypothetical protein
LTPYLSVVGKGLPENFIGNEGGDCSKYGVSIFGYQVYLINDSERNPMLTDHRRTVDIDREGHVCVRFDLQDFFYAVGLETPSFGLFHDGRIPGMLELAWEHVKP